MTSTQIGIQTSIQTRIEGCAGCITLTRPQALNALDHAMCLGIEEALDLWREDDAVALIVIDAEGPRAFCAGGDIATLYHDGRAGIHDTGRDFWRDEYRLNAKLAEYPKPIVSFLHGFVMGGGVGLGCHVSHRIVGETAQISMPECGIGFVPDVGGSLLLARAPGRLGEYLALTAARMGPGDAIHAGFADGHIPEADWPALKSALCEDGGINLITYAQTPPSPMAEARDEIDRLFDAPDLSILAESLDQSDSTLAKSAAKAVRRNSPLSMAITCAMLSAMRAPGCDIRDALRAEYRVAHRIMQQGDFLEGVRAQIIDKDRQPRWRLALDDISADHVANMLAPLGDQELKS